MIIAMNTEIKGAIISGIGLIGLLIFLFADIPSLTIISLIACIIGSLMMWQGRRTRYWNATPEQRAQMDKEDRELKEKIEQERKHLELMNELEQIQRKHR